MMQRGNYMILAGLEETGRDGGHGYAGRYIDLFDPALGYVVRPVVQPGQYRLLRKVPVNHPPQAELLAASARTRSFAVEGDVVRFEARGPANTLCRAVLTLPDAPNETLVDGAPIAMATWEKGRNLARLEFPNKATWVRVELRMQEENPGVEKNPAAQ